MSQLQHSEDLSNRDVKIMVLTFDSREMIKAYLRDQAIDFPILQDLDRELYQAYEFGRATWNDMYSLTSIVKYLKLIFTGWRPGKPGSDWRQLGGDVLIDPQGMVRLHHKSRTPHDRPSIDSLLQLIDQRSIP